MELWIRSQDKKTLMKITRLYEFSNAIFSIDSRDNEIILGTYKKNKRALEVLDEIQKILEEPKTHEEEGVYYYMPNDGSSKIYEMPKE